MGTYERLHAIICEDMGTRPEAVSPGTMLGEISTDNLDWVMVLLEVELQFTILIEEPEFDLVRNVAELVELIDVKLHRQIKAA